MNIKRFLSAFVAALVALCALPLQSFEAAAEEMPYYITVDVTNQIVTVYNTADNTIARQMLCSTGLKNSTPLGDFRMPKAERDTDRKEWYYFRAFHCYAKYASRIYRGILFHSLTCAKADEATVYSAAVAAFGQPASHGCVRLRFEDAEFIAKNCLMGTMVHIFKADEVDYELRELLMQSSFTGEKGQTYSAFLGIPDQEGYLGRASVGDDVTNLQLRLRALGFYTGEIDGIFAATTTSAVRRVQKLMGLETTGYVSPSLLETLYSSQAPTATDVELNEGMSGPSVRALQEWLTDLRLYDGDMDGIYDGDVIDAVKLFQSCYGYMSDGVATTTIQKAIQYEATRIVERFGEDGYTVINTSDSIHLARINAETSIRVREQPTTDSAALDSLRKGTILTVLEKGDTWCKIQYTTTIGYMKTQYLEFSDSVMPCYVYTSLSTGETYQLGHTATEYQSGATIPATEFERRMLGTTDNASSAGLLTMAIEQPVSARVNTGDDSVMLNMRKTASSDGEIIAQIPNGTMLKVVLKGPEWTMVSKDNLTGYMMSEYLTFIMASEQDENHEFSLADEKDEIDWDDTFYALAVANTILYDEDSDDANQVGQLKSGRRVRVLLSNDYWSMIEYNGEKYFVHNEDLQFDLTESYI